MKKRLVSLMFLLLWTVLPVLPQEVQPTAAQRLDQIKEKLSRLDPSTIPELLETADKDPDPAIRMAILSRLSRLDQSAITDALERHASSDPDVQVAMTCLERLRILQARKMGSLFEKRLAMARTQGDTSGIQQLGDQHQRWVTLSRGALMPAFMHAAPPVIDALSAKSSIRMVAIGDIGQPGADQRKVAAAVLAYHRKTAVDLGATLGDNFVPDGVTGPTDPRWMREWEELYGPLNIPFYAATGNHDWGFSDSPATEILYTLKSQSWRMPALYYSYLAGPVQFFVLATHAWSDTQAKWLDQELSRSTARWKVVYGHHGIYSYGTHGDTADLKRSLLPILRNRVQLYLFGHEHIVQHLKPEDGVHFIDAPAGGQKARPSKSGPMTLFTDSFWGFVALEFDSNRIRVEMVDTEGEVRYQTEIR